MTARRERFLNIKEIFMAPNSGGLIDAENGLVSRRIFIEPEIYIEEVRFARDSPLEGAGFEPVWGFSCQVNVFDLWPSSLFGAGSRSSSRRLRLGSRERAEGVKGPKR